MKKSTEDRVEGGMRQGTGKVKQEAGRITRNRSMQAEGFVEKHAGKAQKAMGNRNARKGR